MRLGVEAALVRGELVRGDVEVDGDRVVAVGRLPAGRGGIAVPGFVDVQVNGYGGVDFLAATRADYRRAGEALLAAGVTAYQPTFITSPESTIVEALRQLPANGPGPRVLGAHLEGPFLSPERPGAHPLEHLREADVGLLDRLLDGGRVTEMTLAPELPGADALIARLRERGVVVSAGHTNATAAEAHRAFDLGVTGVTHVFNAMRPFRSRDPGIAGVALTRPDVVVKVIVDGYHLADETVRLVWACASGRMVLISDAIAAAGAGGGTFQLGEVEVEVSADAAPRREDGTLAGTVLTMIDAVRNLHALGIPLEDAIGAATVAPAAFLGRADVGVLEPGGPADVVVLDDRLEIASVLCAGEAGVVARG
ncbi:MAG: N-acetylglucosamine-6-phosphate deacetylase [Thermoleophilia bacterium]|nr:N-acetylglucosamine-6-phosphate deacetylase [Thermoleophilia bacterium]